MAEGTERRKYTAQEKRALVAHKPQVPDSWDEYSKKRAKKLSILDRIEMTVSKHWHNEPDLRVQITAINGSDSMTGYAADDRVLAGARIKKLAKDDGDIILAETPVHIIKNKLQLLKRREGQADDQVLHELELLQAQRAAEGLADGLNGEENVSPEEL